MTDTEIIKLLSQGYITKQIADKAGVKLEAMQQRIFKMRKKGKYINTTHMVAECIKANVEADIHFVTTA